MRISKVEGKRKWGGADAKDGSLKGFEEKRDVWKK